MSEITPDMETIAKATQWLTTSPDTHSGHRQGMVYIVEEMATTDDGSKLSPQGIYFGHRETFTDDGRVLSSSGIKLVDHSDQESKQDHVPLTFNPDDSDHNIGMGSKEAVDMEQLSTFSDEKLARMASNARTVLQHYGVELDEVASVDS